MEEKSLLEKEFLTTSGIARKTGSEMSRKAKKFEWNVWFWNFNQDKLEKLDVVPYFTRSLKRLKKAERPKDLQQLDEFLKSEARYYFMAKCEYEMVLHSWPMLKSEEKVDVYD